jgi:hypothetical protein
MINNEDIHVLGSDKDIRMFKEWKNNNEKIDKLMPEEEVLSKGQEATPTEKVYNQEINDAVEVDIALDQNLDSCK